MASSERFTSPGVDPAKVEKIQNEKPTLRVIEGGKPEQSAGYVPETAGEGSMTAAEAYPKTNEAPVDLKQLLSEGVVEDTAKQKEIRQKIEIPAPSTELSEADIEDIGGVEYLNAQPGGEEVKGSTYESTSDKKKTLRMKNNPLEGQNGYDEAMDVDDNLEEVNADNMVEVQDELPELVQEKGKLPRFEAVSESEFPTLTRMPEVGSQPKGEKLSAEDIISENEAGQLPRFPEDLDKAA